jgi:hypothetical protein
VDGVSAQFAATGQGYSIQWADTMGFTPQGFAGRCLYPNSVFASDLEITFSVPAARASILYAPQELGCDSSATMRLTAWLGGTAVGTTTTNAQSPGTWPSQTLALESRSGFDRVVVHYDARPACTDYGPIFLADNLEVVPAAAPSAPPILRVSDFSTEVELAWPTNAAGFSLEASGELGPAARWGPVTNLPAVSGLDYTLRLTIAPTNVFYRLRHP